MVARSKKLGGGSSKWRVRTCNGGEVRRQPDSNNRVMESHQSGRKLWGINREGKSRDRTLGQSWVELGAGNLGGVGAHCRAEALEWLQW